MKTQLYILIITSLLTRCYVSKEHRHWEKREEKNYPDDYFYQVLKDTCTKGNSKIKFNYPYVSITPEGYFRALTFDKNQNVYSHAWVNEKPEFGNIMQKHYPIGYYKLCGDTLTIEEIGSWTFFRMPWKYVHKKTLGILHNDTLRLSQEQLGIKKKDKISSQVDIYTPLESKTSK